MQPLARRSALLLALCTSLLAACEWKIVDHHEGDDAHSTAATACGRPGQPAACSTESAPSSCGVAIDRWKELMVIHRTVLLDRRAQNEVAGAPWSFRSRMEELAGGGDAAAFTRAWLDTWRTVTVVGPDYAPVTPRPAVSEVLLDPWLAAGGSLAQAPFRLIAIVNRPDLRREEDGCEGPGGELRFVYTALDPTTRKAIAMTVVIEIPYPATRTPRGWIEAWHALAARPFGEEYTAGLAALTTEVTSASRPETWRVRTNEIALGELDRLPWEMREYALEPEPSAARRLVPVPIASTPRIELDRSRSLDSWAKENEPRILDGTFVLPGSLQAGAAPIERRDFRWSSDTMREEVRSAFSMGTCNGCHGGERGGETSLPFQHVAAADQAVEYYAPKRDGETRLSSWLADPSGREDELSRRERSMVRALCGTCDAAAPAY